MRQKGRRRRRAFGFRSVCNENAIDGQCHAQDHTRARAAQPQHYGRNLLRTAESADGLILQKLLHRCEINAVAHWRINTTGADRVDPDAVGRDVQCGALGQSDNAVFAGVIGSAARKARKAHKTAKGSAIDYGTPSLFLHLLQFMFHESPDTAKIHHPRNIVPVARLL